MGVQGYRSHTAVWGATFHCCSLGEGVDRVIKSKESSIQFSPFSGAEWLWFTFIRALAAARGLGRDETLPLSNTVFIKAQRPPKVRVIAGGWGGGRSAGPASSRESLQELKWGLESRVGGWGLEIKALLTLSSPSLTPSTVWNPNPV